MNRLHSIKTKLLIKFILDLVCYHNSWTQLVFKSEGVRGERGAWTGGRVGVEYCLLGKKRLKMLTHTKKKKSEINEKNYENEDS